MLFSFFLLVFRVALFSSFFFHCLVAYAPNRLLGNALPVFAGVISF